MPSLEQRLDRAEEMIKSPAFRRKRGLGNEVCCYIFDYPAKDEPAVRARVEYLCRKHKNAPNGFRIVVFDLYSMIISLLAEKGYLEKCFELEKTQGFERAAAAVGRALRIASPTSLLAERIRQGSPEDAVVFLTGIGKCYPILRAHTVLNNLSPAMDSLPVILFYPGEYDGREFVLFGEKKDGNYYRAFRLVE